MTIMNRFSLISGFCCALCGECVLKRCLYLLQRPSAQGNSTALFRFLIASFSSITRPVFASARFEKKKRRKKKVNSKSTNMFVALSHKCYRCNQFAFCISQSHKFFTLFIFYFFKWASPFATDQSASVMREKGLS